MTTPSLREEAEALYRAAWTSKVLCRNRWVVVRLELFMHMLTPLIEPDMQSPRWRAFVATLPGLDIRDWDQAMAKMQEEQTAEGKQRRLKYN